MDKFYVCLCVLCTYITIIMTKNNMDKDNYGW